MKILPLISLGILGLLLNQNAFALEAQLVSERLPGNLVSWIALGILATSVLTAWLLNHTAPKIRVFGTLLAASGCFALAAWFVFYVQGTGFLENPRPNTTPMDSAKPALLWIQSMAALAFGVGLVLVAIKQSKIAQPLALTAHNESTRYGLVSRMLHWSIAILFLVLIPMGIYTTIMPEGSPHRRDYYVVHETLGVMILVLALIRILWNRYSTRPELESSLTNTERKLAHKAHMALYFMMVMIPVTGYVMTSFNAKSTLFLAWELEPLWSYSKNGSLIWGVLHKYLLPYLLYIVLGAHVLGALKHQFIDKHANAFKRMVS